MVSRIFSGHPQYSTINHANPEFTGYFSMFFQNRPRVAFPEALLWTPNHVCLEASSPLWVTWWSFSMVCDAYSTYCMNTCEL